MSADELDVPDYHNDRPIRTSAVSCMCVCVCVGGGGGHLRNSLINSVSIMVTIVFDGTVIILIISKSRD